MTATGVAIDSDLHDVIGQVFADRALSTAPHDDGDLEFWNELVDLGLGRLTTCEGRGGSGATWLEAADLLRTAARHGIPTPVVEDDLLAGWLLERAGLPVDAMLRTAAVADTSGAVDGVGWAREAGGIVILAERGGRWHVADVPPSFVRIESGTNIAGEARDRVTLWRDDAEWAPVDLSTRLEFLLRGALARAIQTAAALEAAVDQSIKHVRVREQFGRPLSKFHVIQHSVADAAAEASLARAATDSALLHVLRCGWDDPGTTSRIAIARSCTAHATGIVVRAAHQLHGAIGTTAEHPLHRFTLSAIGWRSEFGNPHYWNRLLTDAALRAGGDDLWKFVIGEAEYDNIPISESEPSRGDV